MQMFINYWYMYKKLTIMTVLITVKKRKQYKNSFNTFIVIRVIRNKPPQKQSHILADPPNSEGQF
mgnify:CR=1 FL=1